METQSRGTTGYLFVHFYPKKNKTKQNKTKEIDFFKKYIFRGPRSFSLIVSGRFKVKFSHNESPRAQKKGHFDRSNLITGTKRIVFLYLVFDSLESIGCHGSRWVYRVLLGFTGFYRV